MKLNTVKEVIFKLSNLMGQVIYQSPAYHFSGEQVKNFDEVKLPAGLYSLQTQIGNKVFVDKLFISR